MTRDLYVILGISDGASVGEIKRAYRKLARRYHPDINPGDRAAEELFKHIAEAYEVLSNPGKRGFYDKHGYYTEGVLEERTETSWDISFDRFASSSSEGSSFSELFDQFLNRENENAGEEAGGDLECQISLDFKESMTGVKTLVSVYRKKGCEDCQGSGRAVGADDSSCRSCDGSGQLIKAKGHLRFSITCPTCSGMGRISLACSACNGDGRVASSERVAIQIPAGVSTGSRVRVPGMGDIGNSTHSSGDLFVVTNVEPHPFFNRVGDNIHCSVPITITEAALGAKIRVPTIDGSAMLKIPPGTQSGQTLRMRGKGAPSLRGNGVRGDQYVEVRLRTPWISDERSKEILRELARLNPSDLREDLEDHGN